MIRVFLPAQLRLLAKLPSEVSIDVVGQPTIGSVLDALEKQYPLLEGGIRDHGTLVRRPFVRFFVCGEDWSHESSDKPLPDDIAGGKEPFMVIAAIAGGSGVCGCPTGSVPF